MTAKDKLRIILVEPEQPRNVGAVVRVAANFGLTHLTVVQLQQPSADDLKDIRVASSGAIDLVNVQFVTSVAAGVDGAETVFGTSVRQRSDRIPLVQSINEFPVSGGTTAVLFGRESTGLTREEFGYCHVQLTLPVSPLFPSMNLSHAVALVVYQAFFGGNDVRAVSSIGSAPAGEATRHLQERWLGEIHAIRPASVPQLRRLLHRADPTSQDMALLFNLLRHCRRSGKED